MTHFAFLGTSGAVPSPARDTTSLVFVGPEGAVLVDIEADYHDELPAMADEARRRFGGVVEIAQEFVPYPL